MKTEADKGNGEGRSRFCFGSLLRCGGISPPGRRRFPSINGQIEFLLTECVRKRKG
jgi:hypothetical protein